MIFYRICRGYKSPLKHNLNCSWTAMERNTITITELHLVFTERKKEKTVLLSNVNQTELDGRLVLEDILVDW
jgi:hypothetical protein